MEYPSNDSLLVNESFFFEQSNDLHRLLGWNTTTGIFTTRLPSPDALQPKAMEILRRLCAAYRVNALAAIVEAHHGWLGASFSAMEILAVLYNFFLPNLRYPLIDRNALILSKGHAAAAHYAVLASLGCFVQNLLKFYKNRDGPPAHVDRSWPGVDSDSGSLGQGLSKGIGLALSYRERRTPHRVFVILGDGELQEGQVFESLLTLRHYDLRRCIPIVDRNHLQTDSPTTAIKDAEDWETVFEGIGFNVVTVDGHDLKKLLTVLVAAAATPDGFENEIPDISGFSGTLPFDPETVGKPTIIIAETIKGFGSRVTAMNRNTTRREGIWHGKIPTCEEYFSILEDLVPQIAHHPSTDWLNRRRREMSASFGINLQPYSHIESPISGMSNEAVSPDKISANVLRKTQSTGEAFGEALVELGKLEERLFVLNADLEKACRLQTFARTFSDRFIEVGISEQDMASIGAGLALGGKIAVVNTYASFLKRCLDQISAIGLEGLPVIFAGHYAGLDYFTDGKSHQSLNDIALFRALNVLDVFEPLVPEETTGILKSLVARFVDDIQKGRRSRPAYVRLHRTPVTPPATLPHAFDGSPYQFPQKSGSHNSSSNQKDDSLWICPRMFVAGPQMLDMALPLQKRIWAQKAGLEIIGVSAYLPDYQGPLAGFARSASRIICLESHIITGGLGDLMAMLAPEKSMERIGAKETYGSCRTFDDMLASHCLTLPHIEERVRTFLEKKI